MGGFYLVNMEAICSVKPFIFPKTFGDFQSISKDLDCSMMAYSAKSWVCWRLNICSTICRSSCDERARNKGFLDFWGFISVFKALVWSVCLSGKWFYQFMMLNPTRVGLPRNLNSRQVRSITILSLSLSKGAQKMSQVMKAGKMPRSTNVMILVYSFRVVFSDVCKSSSKFRCRRYTWK